MCGVCGSSQSIVNLLELILSAGSERGRGVNLLLGEKLEYVDDGKAGVFFPLAVALQ